MYDRYPTLTFFSSFVWQKLGQSYFTGSLKEEHLVGSVLSFTCWNSLLFIWTFAKVRIGNLLPKVLPKDYETFMYVNTAGSGQRPTDTNQGSSGIQDMALKQLSVNNWHINAWCPVFHVGWFFLRKYVHCLCNAVKDTSF